jgi:hypothetical protein
MRVKINQRKKYDDVKYDNHTNNKNNNKYDDNDE